MIHQNAEFRSQLTFRRPLTRRPTNSSRSEFLKNLGKSVHEHREEVFLSDDHVQISGFRASKIMEKITKTLEKVCPEQTYVVVSLPHSAAQAATVLAVILSKRIPIVIHPSALNRVLADLSAIGTIREPSAVITDKDGMATDLSATKIIVNSEAEVLNDFSHHLYSKNSVSHGAEESAPALVIYTSGSSGTPKGVAISFPSISYIASTLKETLSLSHETIAAISMPLFHTLALNTQFIPTIMAGGKCVFTPAELQLNSLYRNYLKTKGNYLALIPEVLLQCYQEFRTKELEPHPFVKTVVMAGSNISREHLRIAELIFPKAEIFKGYGLTEAIRVSMISNRDPEFYSDVAGRPLSEQSLSIRSKSGDQVPKGAVGEIFVKGPNTTNFYLNPSTPMLGPDGYLATGDQGYINPKGLLVVSGRSDRVFKSQGRKIAPLEVEKVAMADALIGQAVCVPQICRHKGLRSALFLRLHSEINEGEMARLASVLHGAVAQGLEPYKRPKEVYLSVSLPKLANGKPDVKSLKNDLDSGKFLPQKTLNFKGISFHWYELSSRDLPQTESHFGERA
ncbi:MAG: class I adenylate-forming enzyme family protein [Pseudomonadota bacterium]